MSVSLNAGVITDSCKWLPFGSASKKQAIILERELFTSVVSWAAGVLLSTHASSVQIGGHNRLSKVKQMGRGGEGERRGNGPLPLAPL